MNRRAFLVSLPPSFLIGGCLEGTGAPASTETPSAKTRIEGDQFTASVVAVRSSHGNETSPPPSDANGQFRPTVSASVSCENKTVVLDGWLATSSCRTVAIQSLQPADGENPVTLTLVDAWDMRADPATVDCAGARYRYRIRITAEQPLPTEIQVVHRIHGADSPDRFTIDAC